MRASVASKAGAAAASASAKISALPFALSSADAVAAARSHATVAAHYDERGRLPGFGPYTLLTRLRLHTLFGLGRSYEDDTVELEQAAAVYVPTWIVDAALGLRTADAAPSSSSTAPARASLVLQNARFPGSPWAPVSSLPLWPDHTTPAPAAHALGHGPLRIPGLHPSTSTAPLDAADCPEYEPWTPANHLAHGCADPAHGPHTPVAIDGPITALPFELSPLALPAFLQSRTAGTPELTLSTRQPNTTADLVIVVRNMKPELRSVPEAEDIQGIEMDTTHVADSGSTSNQAGPFALVRQVFNIIFRPERAMQAQQQRAQSAVPRRERLRKQAAIEDRNERTVALRPDSLEVDMLAAYPVMLPIHLIKFSYQPRPPSASDRPPPRQTITVAAAGWDPSASLLLRTLPTSCTWSRWGAPADSIWAYDARLASPALASLSPFERERARTEPLWTLRASPLSVAHMDFVPAAPVRVPEDDAALAESIGEYGGAFFGDDVTAAAASGGEDAQQRAIQTAARTQADGILGAVGADGDEDPTRRSDLVRRVLRQAYKTLVTQLLQNNLLRRASTWLNAAEMDTGAAAAATAEGQTGWASFRAFQQQLFERARSADAGSSSTHAVAGIQLPSSPSSSSSPSTADDPALAADPHILDGVHVQPLPLAAEANRRYLAAVAERTKVEVLAALAGSGDAIILQPVRAGEGEGEATPGSAVEDDAEGEVQGLRIADRRSAVGLSAGPLAEREKAVQELKPEWLRAIHDAERARAAAGAEAGGERPV